MSDGLKDCPFCGGGAVVSGDMSVHCAATCEVCGAGVDATSVTEAVSKWNTRADLCADPALLAEAVEVLRYLLDDIQDYQRINNLGGENNHSQVRARAFLSKLENRHDR